MARSFPSEVVDFGCDWLTVTAQNKHSIKRLYNYGLTLVREERNAGNDKRVFSFKGFDGVQAGSVQTGIRDSGSILRIMGGEARRHVAECFRLADNCSRIDLQTTVRSPNGSAQMIAQEYKRCMRKTKTQERGPTVSLLRTSTGSATMYLGQRVSDRFGRVYDKGAQSLLPVMAGCVRFEEEIKGRLAKIYLRELATTSSVRDFVVGEVQRFARDRGCLTKFETADTQTFVLHRPATDRERQLEWIRTQVRPTVKRLLRAGLVSELWEALNVNELVFAHDKRLEFVSKNSRSRKAA